MVLTPLLIWGAGAIGGTIGASLARAGHEVLFVDSAADHVDRINDHGLTITGPIEAFTVAARAVTPEALEVFEERQQAVLELLQSGAAEHTFDLRLVLGWAERGR